MTNGIAKSASSDSPTSPPSHPDASTPMMLSGVPLDLVRYFSVDISTLTNQTTKQLNDIYSMLSGNGEKMGDILQKIRDIDNRMGQPSFGETRPGRIWNYLRIHNQVVDLQKRRDAMLRY